MEEIPATVHPSWGPILRPLFQLDAIKELKYNILPHCKHYPLRDSIFNAFSIPLQTVRVVILGQDPYPDGRANGYAFAVNPESNKPFSLKTIEKEVGHPIDRTLKPWADQGVLLLNTALTVEAGKPDSHTKYWQTFIESVLGSLSYYLPMNHIVWMLWGSKARRYIPPIASTLAGRGKILTAGHPAAEYHSHGLGGFLGCKHFTLSNEYFESIGQPPIQW